MANEIVDLKDSSGDIQVVAITSGGTGGVTPAEARSNLGLDSVVTAEDVGTGEYEEPLIQIAEGGTGARTAKDAINTLNIYPVGSIYLSVNNVNPSTLFGGIWERIKDVFLLAAGDTYDGGDTGGNATHAHDYGIQLGSYYFDTAYEADALSGVLTYDTSNVATVSPADTGNDRLGNVGLNSSNAAGSATRNNAYHPRSVGNTSYEETLPPYLAVYVWKRVS